MRIVEDGWLGQIMGCSAFRVDVVEGGNAQAVADHAREQKNAFYFSKVPTERIADVKALTRVGFDVVDVNVTFEMAPPTDTRRLRVDVGECTPAAVDAVLDIAGSCFRYSRFHLDPRVEKKIADDIKREWVRNYALKKRGDHLFVAHVDGKPAGFLAAIVVDAHGKKQAVIDLVGVGTEFQKRGVGESLVNAFAEHYKKSVPSLAVGTQVANVPSVRLYEKMGFSFAKSTYVLHKHVPENAP